VDGTQCNDVGAPYNEAFPDPTDPDGGAHAGLDYCKTGIPGQHTIVAELHLDNHNPVKDSAGKTISDSIKITVPGGDAGAPKDAGKD
jgi:hypothetical protein